MQNYKPKIHQETSSDSEESDEIEMKNSEEEIEENPGECTAKAKFYAASTCTSVVFMVILYVTSYYS